jgi:RNA ligase (TIGR02306 family)
MSTFSVTVLPINEILLHPNADSLDIAKIGDYSCIIRKGDFKPGDLVAYIPEASILPKGLIEEMGLTGRLSGSDKDRVKAVRLRGVLSQGLVYRARPDWNVAQNVAQELGITKYEPVLPVHLRGVLHNVSGQRTIKYDIENFRRFPNVFQDGEEVVFTEKLHGTWVQFAVMPESMKLADGSRFIVASKGLGAQGLAFKLDAPENESNLYCQFAKLGFQSRIERHFAHDLLEGRPVFVLGEIFGNGVQDLSYGSGRMFRVFDIYVGMPGHGSFLSDAALDKAIRGLDHFNVDEDTRDRVIQRVPVLYRGPFSREVMMEYTSGKETVSGMEIHIREGIVMRSTVERVVPPDPILGELPCGGRAQLKSVSEAYLLRKGDQTEFQ